MPTKRRRIMRNRADIRTVNPAVWATITDGEPVGFVFDEGEVLVAWRAHRDQILARWIKERPGTRPSCWWDFDAPGPRERIGGRGTPAAGVLEHAPRHVLGVPADWVSSYSVERGVAAERFSAEDPPSFESQAAYLKRLDLLEAGEYRKISPGSFAPEALPREPWPLD